AAKDQKPTLDCRHVPNASSLQWYKSQFVLCGPVKGQNHYGHKVFAQYRSAETDEELTVFHGEALNVDPVFLAGYLEKRPEHVVVLQQFQQADSIFRYELPVAVQFDLVEPVAVVVRFHLRLPLAI